MPSTPSSLRLAALGLCCIVAGWFLQHELSYWWWRGGFVMLAGVVLTGTAAGQILRARRAGRLLRARRAGRG